MLEARVRAPTTAQGDVLRARIVLLAASGRSTRSIAAEVKAMPRIVSLWRGRYAREGLVGLMTRRRPPRQRKYTAQTGRRILSVLDRSPPAGHGRWTGKLIAAERGDVHEQQVWRFLRAQKIDLSGRKPWCRSWDPAFAAKAADVAGLYLAPPEQAIVLSVDEKPHIQALERAQGYLKMPNGRTLTGHSHDYTRHGTSTLFAALGVACGAITAGHYRRRRRVEFLSFMNEIVAAYPGREMHVVLDNLSTHKPKRNQWLKRHRNVRFHVTPTHASWLNQIEVWFSILTAKSLQGASFTSAQQLKDHIDAFIKSYNAHAKPFVWTKTRVRQKNLKPRIAQT